MSVTPQFPDFKPIELKDRDIFKEIIKEYQPHVSEWTFTNFFIWRNHYGFEWSILKNWLIVICSEGRNGVYAMQPLGPPSRKRAVVTVLEWLLEEKGVAIPRIEKADKRLVSEISGAKHFPVEITREHFDYVYRRDDLAQLTGNRYRSKRNHINQLMRIYKPSYVPLERGHIYDCLELQEKWCQLRRCDDDLNLLGEWEAIRSILANFSKLELHGGVVTIEGKVVAFTIGELLNDKTVVVHIEKADPEITGLYQLINQQFSREAWHGITYVNREQDLWIPGLREAKLSYYPEHFVEKFRIRLH